MMNLFFFFFFFFVHLNSSCNKRRIEQEPWRVVLSLWDIDPKKITAVLLKTAIPVCNSSNRLNRSWCMFTAHHSLPSSLYWILNVVSEEHQSDCCTLIPKISFLCCRYVTLNTHCVWHLCIICLSVSNETLTSSLHKGGCVPLIALNEPCALTKRLVLLQLTAVGPSVLAPWRVKILSVSKVCTPFSICFSPFTPPHLLPPSLCIYLPWK